MIQNKMDSADLSITLDKQINSETAGNSTGHQRELSYHVEMVLYVLVTLQVL